MSSEKQEIEINFQTKENLKEILQEEEMVRWLKKLLGIETSSFETEAVELREEIKRLKKENSQFEVEKENLKKVFKNLEEKLSNSEEEKERIENQLKRELKKYESMNQKYEIYEQLSENTKNDLVRIFRVEGVESFIACGAQYDNISSLFEYIKIKIQNGDSQDTEELTELFNYFFQLYNGISETASYRFLETEVEQGYDTETQVRTGDSSMSGNVRKVQLRGYRNNSTNKVIKKSVVKL